MRVLAKGLIWSVLVLLAASPAIAQSPENEAMAQKVAQTLKESGQLKQYKVGVKYQDGTAWLLGTVTSEQQSKIAEELAGRTQGVTRVVNKLEVVAEPPIGPQPVSRDAEVTLTAAPIDHGVPAPARMAGAPLHPIAAPQLGPEPPMMTAARPAAPGMVQTAAAPIGHLGHPAAMGGGPVPMGYSPQGIARTVSYDHPAMPGYAWPAYAAYPNYAALTYPQQYSAAAWPYIGPFYPYPQVPLGWRQVTLEWDDGWWFLDFKE